MEKTGGYKALVVIGILKRGWKNVFWTTCQKDVEKYL